MLTNKIARGAMEPPLRRRGDRPEPVLRGKRGDDREDRGRPRFVEVAQPPQGPGAGLTGQAGSARRWVNWRV